MSDSPPIRVVLDTNILLSACLKPEGLEAKTVRMTIGGELTWFVTVEIEAEYRDVLFRPKFAAFHVTAGTMLEEAAARWMHVTPSEKLCAAADEDDNRFLECAQAASANFLVTGNLRHYPARWSVTRIVNAREFLSFMEAK